jgi:hypothetical protein
MVENENKDVKKDVFRPNINGSLEQRRMEAQKRKDLPIKKPTSILRVRLEILLRCVFQTSC